MNCKGCRYWKWWQRHLSDAQGVKLTMANALSNNDPLALKEKERMHLELASEFCRKKMTNVDGSCGHYRQRWWTLRQRRDINAE